MRVPRLLMVTQEGAIRWGHKGARSGSDATKFKINVPPYRWQIVRKDLPECEYFVFDPITGVFILEGYLQ